MRRPKHVHNMRLKDLPILPRGDPFVRGSHAKGSILLQLYMLFLLSLLVDTLQVSARTFFFPESVSRNDHVKCAQALGSRET